MNLFHLLRCGRITNEYGPNIWRVGGGKELVLEESLRTLVSAAFLAGHTSDSV